MFEILIIVSIISTSANSGSAVAISKIGKYDDGAACEQIAAQLNGTRSGGWSTQYTSARCVQVIDTPKKASK